MFCNTIGPGAALNFGFPDVCKTPVGPLVVPLPYPNIAMHTMHVPSQTNIIIGGGLAENLMTMGTLSNGDNAGVLMGVISSLDMGPDRNTMGSTKVLIGGAFATRLTSTTGQNGVSPNTVGMTIAPSQVTVLILS